MSNRATHIIGWFTVAASLLVGLLGAAPFTPAIFLVAILLPVAALLAWCGAVVAGLLSFLLCVFAFAISPILMDDLIKVPFGILWLVFCSVAVILSAVHGVRIKRSKRAAVNLGRP